MSQKTKQSILFIIGLVASIGFDQWTKMLAVAKLKDQAAFVIWPGVFELLYVENRGAAFGMMQGRQTFFMVVGLVVVLLVIYVQYKIPANRRFLPLTACLFLIVSGAIGNMIDRVRLGYVVDFFYFKLIDFPVFNVADCYVCVAAALLIVLFLFYYKDEELDFLTFHKKGEA